MNEALEEQKTALYLAFCGCRKKSFAPSIIGFATYKQIKGINSANAIETNTGRMTVISLNDEPAPRLDMI
jgi:hypothetical protein